MKTRLICSIAIGLCFAASPASAQIDVGVSAAALLAIQPIDDSYVGSPYLSEGIGGIAPGFTAGASVIVKNGLVVAGEYSTVRFEKVQNGRLVLGGFPLEGVPATTRLHDSLLTVLAGYAKGGSTKVVFLGGISVRLDRPTIDDVEAEDYENDEGVLPPLTGGVDVIHSVSSRAQVLITAR
jgi:hypothetical protein